jgi:ATP-dependent helicase/nuclease subunit A
MYIYPVPNQFKIVKSSAGSGKTFTLVKEYLCLVLKKPEDYRHILALTFTNKATEEMKTRIVESLIGLSNDKNDSLKKILEEECELDNIPKRAQSALDNILHDYSNFSVSTIDSFFNRIIRSLAREINLPLRLEVKIEPDEVITEITSQLLSEISNDPELLDWLTKYALQKIGDDKGWNIEKEIHGIAAELFKENSIEGQTHNREEIKEFYNELRDIKSRFEGQMKTFGNEGMKAMKWAGLEVKDFAYGESGPAKYFDKIRMKIPGEAYKPPKRAIDAAADVTKWASKSSPNKNVIQEFAESTLQPLLSRIFEFIKNDFAVYLGATEVLKKIFLLGIVEDLKKKLAAYRDENSMLLISDTPKVLGKVISEEETPFVYEKSGTRYHHFLVDEVQDTSDLQWKNIKPLILHALSSGHFGMVVGDAKQSIYRWRGGNMNLLESEIEKDLAGFKSIISKDNLGINYRSRKAIVDFNNNFFTAVPSVINRFMEVEGDKPMDRAYSSNASQMVPDVTDEGGYVEVFPIEESEDEEITWKDTSKEKMLSGIKDVLKRGYDYKDIAVLVRTNSEGDTVATYLIENGITSVVSPDSLLLHRSAEVRFLLNLLTFLDDQKNAIAKSEILYYYSIKNQFANNLHGIFSGGTKISNSKYKNAPTLFETEHMGESLFSEALPEAFTAHVRALSKLPLYELSEQLVSIFSLPSTDAYVLRFLELILEYASKHDTSIRSFLNWWNDSNAADKISVVTSEAGNAIRIMSIHKSKGLQFPVVFIPFADWKILPDARDVLWVESNDEPFSRFGKIPVSPGKSMRDSTFATSYFDETIQSVTDNINLMYVAFTRAEEELYVFFPASEIKEMNTTGKLAQSVIQENIEWAGNIQDQVLRLGTAGEKRKKNKPQQVSAEKFSPGNYPALNWKNKIRLSLKSDDLVEIMNNTVKRAINYGVLVHRVMSSIKKATDANHVVEKFHADGIITADEKQTLMDEIRLLLEVKEIAAFFHDDYKVMNEHEIILPDGETMRPDRVLIKDNKAIIIDFKTGKEHASHSRQVTAYAEALQKMKFMDIEKYLIYIGEKRILRVQ